MQPDFTDASSLARQSSHALVGLLTSKLDNSSPSRRLYPYESCDNGLQEKIVRDTWLQRRGRPGITPEFPVVLAGRTLPGQPPTPDSIESVTEMRTVSNASPAVELLEPGTSRVTSSQDRASVGRNA